MMYGHCTRMLAYAAMAAAMTLTCSCGEQGTDHAVAMESTAIVTYEGRSGGSDIFTFNKVDDTPELTLVAPATVSGIDAGKRLLVGYIPASGNPYASGNVEITGWASINQGKVALDLPQGDGAVNPLEVWNATPVYLYSAWRSGHWLNLHVRLPYTQRPRRFSLQVDPSTLDAPFPSLYLVHAVDGDTGGMHTRDYYASFDLSELWGKSTVQGIELNVANENLDKHIFTFHKGTAPAP